MQAGEFVFLPCFKRGLAKGFPLFFPLQEFGDCLTEDPVRCSITGISQFLKPRARGFVQFDGNWAYCVHEHLRRMGIIR